MIEKKFPRKLNKSADSRRLAADEMSDALNINVSEDGSGEGNSGVIKPLKSNTPLDAGFDLASESDKTVLGKVSCDKYNVIYFFVYNADGNHGIYAYDPDEYLPGSNGKNGITKVFESTVFKFQETDFIKADITYVQRNYVVDDVVYEDVPFIFFTDNQSEPKKINVLRAITEDYSEAEADINDFLFACPKTPTTRVQAYTEGSVWENYPDYNANEFLGIEGFQFAFQNIYKDGSETALSSFSDIFVPPGYLQYSGSSDIQILNQLNSIQLTIPNDDMSSEVESVKLLCRRGNSGSWFLLKEFDYSGDAINYIFLNDEVNSAVSQDTQIKQFDNLPQRAEAQAIIGNRLMYGNYVDGFDQSTVEIDNAVSQPSDRPGDFVSYEVEVLPSSCPSPYEYDGVGAQNKNMGFTIDGSNLPDEIAEGSFISFSFAVQPKQNFHIYNATNSYHQSPQMGEDFDARGINNNGIGTNDDWNGYPHNAYLYESSPVTGHPYGHYWQSPQKSGSTFMEQQLKNYSGIPACCSDGVNKSFFPEGDLNLESKWRWRYFDQVDQESKYNDWEAVDFGTSAANPLIIQGQSVTISCSFVANQTLTPLQVVDTIAAILSGETFPEPSGNGGGETSADNTTGEKSIVETNARDIQYPGDNDLFYSIDLGLEHGSKISETSAKAKLITMVGGVVTKEYVEAGGTLGEPYAPEDTGGGGTDDGGGSSSGRIEGSREPNLIKGFFVVNKANVSFGIFRDLGYNVERIFPAKQYANNAEVTTSEAGENNLRVRFGVYVKEIDVPPANDSVLSCFRRPLPGAKWWCFAPFNTPEGADPFSFFTSFKQEFNLYAKNEPEDALINLPGFAMSHNLSGDFLDAESVPQDFINRQFTPGNGGEDASGKYSLFNDIKEDVEVYKSIKSRKEASIFVDNQQPSGTSKAPWRTIFGGLYYNPNNDESSRLFHQGEDTSGTPMYSLMDGAGGPGSEETVDSNSPYDRYICNRAGGINADNYLIGVGKLGSAPLFGFGRSLGLSSGEVPTTPTGGYGPILNNNILIARNETIGFFYLSGSDTEGWLNYKLPQIKSYFDGEIYSTQNHEFSASLPIDQYREEPRIPLYWVSSMPMIHCGSGYLGSGFYANETTYDRVFINAAGDHFDEEPFSLLDEPNHLYANQLSSADSVNAVISVVGESSGGQTFKAGANHAFGLVFYDERGRSSNVTPLGSVYVPWFGDRANGEQGLVSSISIDLSGEPPEGASKFRFVYSGNTTMSRFVQYSTAGAFVSTSATDQFSGNIYVSLNHLQQNSASFAKSYGARGLDGSQDIYTFREGDRLRIISYYEGEGRIFTSSDYEFNIVDQVVLGEGDDNPLYNVDQDGSSPHKAKVGSFLVLENNTNAIGFTYDQVKLGENDPDATSHYWGSRCVVEIYSPKTSQDEENLVYYEIGDVKDINALEGNHIVTGGDVWWRTVPVNFQKFENNVYKSIITNESSDPNFLPYNVESQVFNEKVRNSDVWGKGKVKVYLPDEERSVKSSSITYSDKDNPISKVLSLTSFNPAKAQYKDLPAEFGDINYMINNDDSIFVIQSNRCSSVPVNRNLITDGGGSETLVAAREVLGTERYYAGNYGCDNNPESVCNIGNTVYFASKSNRQVYKFNPSNGIQVISDAGMKGYFKKLFEKAEEDREAGQGPIKVVGGYDPYNDNYILSVYNQTTEYSSCDTGSEGTGIDPVVDEGNGGDTVTVVSAPSSVTIDIAEIVSYFSAAELIALASGTYSGNFGAGTIGTNDLLVLLAEFGATADPPTEITFIDQDDDGVTFNYPSE